MKIEIKIPYSREKNLGKSYNEAFCSVGEEDWLCIHDYDTQFLLPDTINHLYTYVEQNPEAGILTCMTNRVSPLSRMQLLGGTINEDADMRRHYMLAENQAKRLYRTQVINRDISGFLMLISKKTWNRVKFKEDGGCLGIDTAYGRALRATGKKIILMEAVYVFHFYRMMNGVFDKSHLL